MHYRTDGLDYTFPLHWDVDYGRLERVWAALDELLATAPPVTVCEVRIGRSRVRWVEALQLVQARVSFATGGAEMYGRDADGGLRQMGYTLPMYGLFRYTWWMRFAFYRWAPFPDGNDWIEVPGNHPGNQSDTYYALKERLNVDRRFHDVSDSWDRALGIPPGVIALAYTDALGAVRMGNIPLAWSVFRRTRASMRAAGLPMSPNSDDDDAWLSG